jgi:hypothetical protein
MNIFISWSGRRSHSVALTLERYLPGLIQSAKPWVSSQDISAGSRWSTEVAANLEAANVGIICLTAENRNEPWINFEAGSIAKMTSIGRAMVLRIGLSPSEITGPLAQFQSVATDKAGIWKLLEAINKGCETPIRNEALRMVFDGLWNQMDPELQHAVRQTSTGEPPARKPDDMLREIIELVRGVAANSLETHARLKELREAGIKTAEDSVSLSKLFKVSTLMDPERNNFAMLNSLKPSSADGKKDSLYGGKLYGIKEPSSVDGEDD